MPWGVYLLTEACSTAEIKDEVAKIDKLIKKGEADCKLLESHDKWFGVTYAEDKASVCEAIAKLIADGVYPAKLWE